MSDKSTLSLVFFILVTISCNKPNGQEKIQNEIFFTENDLPKAKILKGEKYNFIQIVNPRGIFLLEDLAVIYERKNTSDDKFHIIDLESQQFLYSKGIDGLGPGEITVIAQIDRSEEENFIWTYDPEIRKFSKFNVKDSSKLATKQIRSPEISFFVTEATLTSDSTLLGSTVDGWTKYLHLTFSGDTLGMLGNWKDMLREKELPGGLKTDDLDANLVSNIFQGPIKANPDRSKLVKVGKSVDYLEIVDLNENKMITINGPSQVLPYFTIGYSMGYQMPNFGTDHATSYSDLYAGENSFFALYRGKPFRELSNPDNLNRIFEFDYQGKILNQYQLDFPIYGIAVDEENRSIYGVTVDREPNLVRFDY